MTYRSQGTDVSKDSATQEYSKPRSYNHICLKWLMQ